MRRVAEAEGGTGEEVLRVRVYSKRSKGRAKEERICTRAWKSRIVRSRPTRRGGLLVVDELIYEVLVRVLSKWF